MQKIEIQTEADIIHARRRARELAETLDFSVMAKTRLATAVSELARNVFHHGGGGHMILEEVKQQGKAGVRCVFIDQGPGIPDVTLAMMDGYSTGKTLGHGLPGSKRLVDKFNIESQVGQGSQIEIIKWK